MSIRTTLTAIVKNEAATLAACLGSVRDIVDEIVVVDTGSTDRSKDIAAEFGARVFDFPWCDSFAAARNESIRHANGQWLLWLDADESFDEANRDRLRALLANLPDDNAAFVMRQRSTATRASATLVGQVRLFRNLPDIRWDYRVHEQILTSLRKAGHAIRVTDIYLEHSGYQDPALRHRKLERNLRLLHLDRADRPNDPFTLFNLGWAFADLGRLTDAIPLLQHSLRFSHPADSITPKLYVLLSQCHRRLGQRAEAWAACQAGHVRCSEDGELLFLRGQLCHERGDRVEARACWLRLLQENARSLTVAAPMAEGAFTSVDAGLRGPLVRHHLAVLAREESRLDEAESHWRAALADAIRRAPGALTPYVILSHVLLQSGDENAAEPLLRQIVAMASDHAESWRNLAVLLRRKGRMREAIAATQSGRLHCPNDADLLLLHGVLLREGGDSINAERTLLHLLELDTGNGAAGKRRATGRHNLACIYRDMGRVREAVAQWRALLADAPDHAEARRCLAECERNIPAK